jgi:predicted tellurium resistance membrane protein TerC
LGPEVCTVQQEDSLVPAICTRAFDIVLSLDSVITAVGMALIADGSGAHLPKGYIYTAIGFSILVELLNQLAGRRRSRRAAADQ